MNCGSCLKCLDDCEVIVCPDCFVVSPVEENMGDQERGIAIQVLLDEELTEAVSNRKKDKDQRVHYLPQLRSRSQRCRHGVGLGFKM